MLAVTRLHQIAHNRNLVFRHGPNLHQIKTLHGILAHKLLLGIETYILSHQSCWRSYRPGVSFLLTPSNSFGPLYERAEADRLFWAHVRESAPMGFTKESG